MPCCINYAEYFFRFSDIRGGAVDVRLRAARLAESVRDVFVTASFDDGDVKYVFGTEVQFCEVKGNRKRV